METLAYGDRVRVIDGPRHLLGEKGSVKERGGTVTETDVYVILDCGARRLFDRAQVLKIGEDRTT